MVNNPIEEDGRADDGPNNREADLIRGFSFPYELLSKARAAPIATTDSEFP
jgi:hypothetical protein